MENRIKNLSNKNKLNSNKLLLYFLMLVFCIGELIGTILYCTMDNNELSGLSFICGNFFDNRLQCTFIQTVINSFSGVFILLVVCMIFGFGAIFQPAAVIVPFFRGLGIGITIAEINGIYGIKGFLLSLVIIIPYAVISAVVIIVASRESILMSCGIFNCVINKNHNCQLDFKLYLTKFLVLTAVLAVSSLIDSLLTFMFAGFWTRLQGM